MFAAIMDIGTIGCAVWDIIMSVVIGIVEIPFCCSCFEICRKAGASVWCRHIDASTRKGAAIRGVFYICLVTVHWAIWSLAEKSTTSSTPVYLLVAGLIITIDGAFYLFAVLQGKSAASNADLRKDAANKTATLIKENPDMVQQATTAAVDYAKEHPDVAVEVAKAGMAAAKDPEDEWGSTKAAL